jgi:hypothetical protein
MGATVEKTVVENANSESEKSKKLDEEQSVRCKLQKRNCNFL